MTIVQLATNTTREADSSGLLLSVDFPHAQSVPPNEARQWIQSRNALLVNVRTAEEREFVGHLPDSLHVSLRFNGYFYKEGFNHVS